MSLGVSLHLHMHHIRILLRQKLYLIPHLVFAYSECNNRTSFYFKQKLKSPTKVKPQNPDNNHCKSNSLLIHLKPSMVKSYFFLSFRHSCSTWTLSNFALTLDKLTCCTQIKTKNPNVGHELWFLCVFDRWIPAETYLETFLTTVTTLPQFFCLHSSIPLLRRTYATMRAIKQIEGCSWLSMTGLSSVVITTFWVRRMDTWNHGKIEAWFMYFF